MCNINTTEIHRWCGNNSNELKIKEKAGIINTCT